VTGWVRNLSDGDVEILAEGGNAALIEFREWLDEGPPGAWIQSIDVEKRAPTGKFESFYVEY
jgi:acylphosphatase